MKKLIFTSFFILTTLWGFSQITITNANLAPEGVTVITANDTLPDSTIVPGNAGSNQTWNFTAATADVFDTVYTELPSWTPYADSFPDANYVLRLISFGDTTYAYTDKNDDYFAALGYVGNNEDFGIMALQVIPQEIIMDFPVEYGNQRSENFYYEQTVASTIPGSDSLRFKTSSVKSVSVDAWGTISMPTGSYNCLRTVTNRTDYDSVWLLLYGNWALVSNDSTPSVTYDWYTNETLPGFHLFTLEYTDSVVSNVSYVSQTIVGIKNQNKITAVIAPNPVKSTAVIRLGEEVKGNVKLYNQAGVCVVNKSVNGRSATLNVESLPAGIYVVVVSNKQDNKRFTGKLVKE